ncbi:universal stress protein [Haloarchaeobius salinus]|uniref:universal stress protein n=1 Tax=Haloarchaeobius salinus TaxID=1198298 RepID=UPI002108A70A|nr:universal stress protein [Haloarchaeobius salinus]
MSKRLTDTVVVPVAHESDARKTAAALEPYDVDRVVVVHVVEKAGGAPDKTPVEQSEEIAEASFAAFRETFPDADDALAYRRDVVGGIIDLAEQEDASAIAFRPREEGRIVRFLSGDHSLRLVTQSPIPVISLPSEDDE